MKPGLDTMAMWSRAETGAVRLGSMLQVALRRLKDLDVHVFELEGQLRGRVTVKALFAGRSQRLDEVRHFLFNGPVTMREIGDATPLNLRRRVRAMLRPGVDLALWEAWPWDTTYRHGENVDSYVVQPWLDARASPGRDWDSYLGSRVAENARRASHRATHGALAVHVCEDKAQRDLFYSTMLLPMANTRYGLDVHVPDPGHYKALLASPACQLLLVTRAGQALAGAWLSRSARRAELALPHYGALPEVLADNALRRDVMALLNTVLFRTACAQGLNVNLALTRPYLDDGVFNHKRQWGCSLEPIPAFGRYRMQYVSRRQDLLLGAAPVFHLTHAGLSGLMAFQPSTPQPERELAEQLARAAFPGLGGVTVRVCGDRGLMFRLSQSLASVKGTPVWYVPGEAATPDHATTVVPELRGLQLPSPPELMAPPRRINARPVGEG